MEDDIAQASLKSRTNSWAMRDTGFWEDVWLLTMVSPEIETPDRCRRDIYILCAAGMSLFTLTSFCVAMAEATQGATISFLREGRCTTAALHSGTRER